MCVLSENEIKFFTNKIKHKISMNDYVSVEEDYNPSYSSCGAYRITFFSKNCEYVIKIPYTTEGIFMCEKERDLFNKVLRGSKLEKYFAAFYEEITICGNRCFIFEKINDCGKCIPWRRGISCEDITDIARLLDKYEIRDLHQGNYGHKDGHTCFVDYAPRTFI